MNGIWIKGQLTLNYSLFNSGGKCERLKLKTFREEKGGFADWGNI
jgi:hypothetical protein